MPKIRDVVSRLDTAVDRDRTDVEVAVHALPGVLAAAAALVLDVDGASLSLLGLDLRVPLGASSAEAAVAERLQFTLGQGPCLDVARELVPVVFGLEGLTQTWPLYAREFTAATSYRSVASVPLPFTGGSGGGGGGAMDLYHRHHDGSGRLDLDDARLTAEWIVGRLVGSQSPTTLAGPDDVSKVPWLAGTDTRRRMEVWVAMGVLNVRLGLDSDDALAAMRQWAFGHHSDVDTVAADLVAVRLDPERLRP